jgi:hypothetical protein
MNIVPEKALLRRAFFYGVKPGNSTINTSTSGFIDVLAELVFLN